MAIDYNTLQQWSNVGTRELGIEGSTIASAATIAPTHRIHLVSGVAAIVTITPPWDDFAGTLTLIPTGIWTWTAAGNISVLGTTTAATLPVVFVYVKSTGKWYPSRVS